MLPHLVIGASGLVGNALMRSLAARGLPAVGTYHHYELPGLHPLDLACEEAVRALIAEVRPAVIHLPAAVARVDACERDPAATYAVNVRGVRHVRDAAAAIGARVVYYSTDYVFPGEGGPYREEDPIRPLQEYGRQKAWAEHTLLAGSQAPLILRPAWIYGWDPQRTSFACQVIDRLRRGERFRAFVDQIGHPTYAPDLAAAAIALVEAGATGIFHVAGAEAASRYEQAVATAEAFGLDPDLIEGIPSAAMALPAPRPPVCRLCLDKLERTIGWRPRPYREALRAMVDDAPR